jgi:hypothetical protein
LSASTVTVPSFDCAALTISILNRCGVSLEKL